MEDELANKLSTGLSIRQKQYKIDGNNLNDNSKKSEKVLNLAIEEIILPYCKKKAKELFNADVKIKKSISLYELQVLFQKNGGPEPNIHNKKVCMKPDGGIFFVIINGKEYPVLVIEDKIQGTNDIRKKNGNTKQSTGNAIERGGKNIRGAEMLFSSDLNIFPYALFASGCDFHSSETISKRIEMMNYGFPNHTIELTSNVEINVKKEIEENILPKININNRCQKQIVSVFVKTHKWDDLENGSSRWKKDEIATICCTMLDQAFDKLKKYISNE